MSAQLSRTYYFQGELLGADDFVRDQQYVRDLIAAQNQGLYAPGIARGLALTFTGTVLQVAPGLAYDARGTPIVASEPFTRDLAGDRLPAGTYDVRVLYSDSLSNQTPQEVLAATHAIVEQPRIDKPAPPPGDASAIVVGQVTIDDRSAITGVSDTGRQLTSLAIPQASVAPAAKTPSLEATIAALTARVEALEAAQRAHTAPPHPGGAP